MPAHHDETQFPRCEACGDRIGVYERIWVRHPDGRLESSSLLALDAELDTPSAQLYHTGCLAPSSGPDAP